jgi:hypothetical protein
LSDLYSPGVASSPETEKEDHPGNTSFEDAGNYVGKPVLLFHPSSTLLSQSETSSHPEHHHHSHRHHHHHNQTNEHNLQDNSLKEASSVTGPQSENLQINSFQGQMEARSGTEVLTETPVGLSLAADRDPMPCTGSPNQHSVRKAPKCVEFVSMALWLAFFVYSFTLCRINTTEML